MDAQVQPGGRGIGEGVSGGRSGGASCLRIPPAEITLVENVDAERKTKAWYGIPGNAPTLCAVHKKVGTMPQEKARTRKEEKKEEEKKEEEKKEEEEKKGCSSPNRTTLWTDGAVTL